MDFLHNRWIRAIGLVPMTVYSYLAVISVYAMFCETINRPPNQVFPGTDLIGMLGYLFFLSIIGTSGVFAFVTAYFMRGVFKILYVAGALAVLSSVSYLPLSFIFNAEVDFHPNVASQQFMVGKWMDTRHRLDLMSDSSYVLAYGGGSQPSGDSAIYRGVWRLEGNDIYLSNPGPRSTTPWNVRTSDGYYFITYAIPANPDAWSGNLGLMRESDWTN
ncbi:MAG: hypothetical protein KOO62_09070 [candidate division Zixibacteria bacterium]|nr:hypothetical protein [candidate division Zixibacteria bacterium]